MRSPAVPSPLPTAGSEVASRAECVWIAIAALASVSFFFAIAWYHGAVGAARNDDWAFYQVAFRFADTGRFEPNGWQAMMFVGQAVLAWPLIKLFGHQIVPLQIFVSLLGAASIWCMWWVIRTFLPRGWALAAIGCVVAGPMFGSMTVSFMTDVPALALQAVTLALGLRVARARLVSPLGFLGVQVCALAAFSVREHAIAAAVAVTVVVLERVRRDTPSRQTLFVAMAVTWLAAVAAMYVWRHRGAESMYPELEFDRHLFHIEVVHAWRAMLSLAFFVSPVLLTVAPRGLVRRLWAASRWRAIAVVCVFTAAVVVLGPGFLGNYFEPRGSYSITLDSPNTPYLTPVWLWDLLRVAALASIMLAALLGALWWARRSSAPPGAVARGAEAQQGMTLAVTYGGMMLAVIWVGQFMLAQQIFDRHLVGLVFIAAALAVRTGLDAGVFPAQPRFATALCMALLASVGFRFVDASAAFDGGKWQLARAVEQMGIPPATIDGGLEWFGFHQPDHIQANSVGKGNWWLNRFAPRPICSISFLESDRLSVAAAQIDSVLVRRHVKSLTGLEYRFAATDRRPACTPP